MKTTQRLEFPGHNGGKLAARLENPAGTIRAYAIFAHCFTCSKDLMAVRRIADKLTQHGIAVLRFDFTGLGHSEGDFGSTNFSSNVQDLRNAADYLRDNFGAPQILIGHSLGGAAVLAAAGDIPSLRSVVTIGAPADVEHVLHNFDADLSTIETEGEAKVKLGGREFRIEKQFLDDARGTTLEEKIAKLKKPLLVMHAPRDAQVGVENATKIFKTAKHPKSFVSLDDADHLLTKSRDAEFAASVIAGWLERYLDPEEQNAEDGREGHVRVSETGQGKFQQRVIASGHRLMADEPKSFGGDETGPTPYNFLAIGLAACTSMTLRVWAQKNKVDLGRVTVDVSHGKIHATDCDVCTDEQSDKGGRIDRFERRITVEGGVSDDLKETILKIADRCPVHQTLEASSAVATVIEE